MLCGDQEDTGSPPTPARSITVTRDLTTLAAASTTLIGNYNVLPLNTVVSIIVVVVIVFSATGQKPLSGNVGGDDTYGS